jgi:hypothetical protein
MLVTTGPTSCPIRAAVMKDEIKASPSFTITSTVCGCRESNLISTRALESLLGKQLSDNSGRVQAIAEREAELVLNYGLGSPR